MSFFKNEEQEDKTVLNAWYWYQWEAGGSKERV
jgi:hypothetical protein